MIDTQNLEICITYLLQTGQIEEFYNSKEWKKLKKEVLKEQKYECQYCKEKGKYSRATTVHHQFYVRYYPQLALSKTNAEGKQNLVAVCHKCHNDVHNPKKQGFVNEERW